MKKKGNQVNLEPQTPGSFPSTDDEVKVNQQESSNGAAQAAPQPGPSKTSSTPPPGSCASPEFEALFVEWPFKASSRAQTAMPPTITHLTNNLPTREERIISKQLWNPSLPIVANVGIIEYNRVDGAKFKEKVGEGWSRGLEELSRELNVAAEVIAGKGKGRGSAVGVERKGKEVEGDAHDRDSWNRNALGTKTVELPRGQGREPENEDFSEARMKTQEPQTTSLSRLAEVASLVAKTEEGSNTAIAKFTRGGKGTPKIVEVDATDTAMSLLSLSSPQTDKPTPEPSALAATNSLSALWYLIARFFSSGPSAASYLFVALEAAVRVNSTTVHPLHIPAPPSFWADSVPWTVPKVGMTLILTLAASKKNAFDAFARFSKSLGKPASTVSEMRSKPSASLRKAILRAKDDASTKGRTTFLGVNLRDVLYAQLCEVHGKEIKKYFATFARMFVLGVCPDGAKLWLVGGKWGETATVWEGNSKVGAGVGTWEEMDEFVRAFEGFAVADAQWNTKRFKWYHRCFAVDLKQFDLQISEEEKQKRGIREKVDGTKKLFNEIEAWVEIYKIEGVQLEDVGKFMWL